MNTIVICSGGFDCVSLYAPYVHVSKAGIVSDAAKNGTPLGQPLSCYKGDRLHYAPFGTFVERRDAFDLADVDDPMAYVEPDFWLAATDGFYGYVVQ